MKNRRLMLLAMLLTLVGSIFADNLTVSSVELKAGESKDVAINLNNSEKQYAAFQFDIVLPEGISIAKNDKGKLKVSLNAERIDDHTLTVQDLGSGTYRLVCFSMSNTELSGTSGALVNMTLQADEGAGAGAKEGEIKSQVFTEPGGNQAKWADVSFSITIKEAGSMLRGDANGDGVVDIADAVHIVNYIVGKIPSLAPRSEMNMTEPE